MPEASKSHSGLLLHEILNDFSPLKDDIPPFHDKGKSGKPNFFTRKCQ